MKRKYTCENFGECDQADSFEPFELDEHEEKKCPKCGRDDTLVEEEQSGIRTGGNNPFINKLKTPLVAGIIGGVALLGGGAYYCLSGDSVCFSNSTSTQEQEGKERQAQIQKEKEERERQAQIQKKKEERERQAQIERERNKKYSLTINKPSGSHVILVNLPKNMTYHDGIKIKNGTNVHIRIKKDGFKTKDLWVKMDRNINKTIHLEPKPKIEPVIHESYINEDEYVEQTPIEQHTTTTVVIVPSSSKSCRDDLEELKRLKKTDITLAARKKMQISKSNKCSASETAELLNLKL